MDLQPAAPPCIGRVAIIDDDSRYAALLEHEFNALGYEVTRLCCADALSGKLSTLGAAMVVVEPRGARESESGIVAAIRALLPSAWLVVHSAHASVTSAVHAIRKGASDYVPKPATAKRLLSRAEVPQSLRPMTLDQAKWEYINGVIQNAGSMSAAARLLGIDRRSLRRMLARSTLYHTEWRCD